MHIYVFQEDNYLSKKKINILSDWFLQSFYSRFFFSIEGRIHTLLLFSIFKIGKKTGNLFC